MVDLPKNKDNIEYLAVMYKIKIDKVENQTNYIITPDLLDSEDNFILTGVIFDYTNKVNLTDKTRYEDAMNKEFLDDQKEFMVNEKNKKSLSMSFCTANNLMLLTWQSDYNINLGF